MNARRLVPVAFAALLGLAGCSGPDATPESDEPKPPPEVAKDDLPVAPAPRAKADGLPSPPAISGAFPKQSKPWSELIVGKWLYTGRDIVGQRVWEFTRDGRLIRRYSYPAAPGRPKGIEGGTQEYRVNGNILFPTSTYDDGIQATESTTFIKSLTESELVIFSFRRIRRSLWSAKHEAARREVPLNQVLAEVVREEWSQGSMYVRLKDKDR